MVDHSGRRQLCQVRRGQAWPQQLEGQDLAPPRIHSYKDDPHARGGKLLAFLVPVAIAEHIRDTQKGMVNSAATLIDVFHRGSKLQGSLPIETFGASKPSDNSPAKE